jgi:Acetyltransferases, including N-acetylases of ribosomal proteins
MISVSENITLRPLSMGDVPFIFNIINMEREYLRQWLPFVDITNEIEDTEHSVNEMMLSSNEQFSIYTGERLIGLVGFKDTDTGNRKTEIGYWLSQTAQGKGIMTNSVKSLLSYAFDELEMNRVQIRVAVDNHKSRKIPERLGFKLEGIERCGELLADDVFTDLAVYSLLAEEFKYIETCK